jgi:hypothetical protein
VGHQYPSVKKDRYFPFFHRWIPGGVYPDFIGTGMTRERKSLTLRK